MRIIASAHAYAVRTELYQVSRPYIARGSFLENNFADFLDDVLVKIIKITSNCWWRFITTPFIVAVNYCQLQVSRKFGFSQDQYLCC